VCENTKVIIVYGTTLPKYCRTVITVAVSFSVAH